MVINGKKYIVKVPTGKTTNDFQFDELLPAFRKYCAKVAQNQATRIASFTSPPGGPQAHQLGGAAGRSLGAVHRLPRLHRAHQYHPRR